MGRVAGAPDACTAEVAPKESIRLIVREVPLTHFAAGGVTLAERAGEPDPRG
jgi:phenylpyruvate tautomerase PptA (4-oxalocrotonate tautomerase family)